MLLPPLCTQSEYVAMAKDAGFKVFAEPLDISKEVARTW
jgi:tocopherol O-methyltransferase